MILGLGLTKIIPLFVYCLAILTIILTLIRRAEWGLYFLIMLIPLQTVIIKLHKYPFGKDIIDILFISIILGYFFQQRFNKQTIPHSRFLNKAIILLLLVTYSGLWVGSFKFGLPYPITLDNPHFIQWKNYAMLPLLYFVTLYIIQNRKQMELIIWLMMATMFLMNNEFYQNVRWFTAEHYTDKLRETGTFIYLGPNELAGFYVQYTLLFIGILLFDKNKLRKLSLLGIISFNFYCIIFLYSRGAYLASIVGLAFYGILKNRLILVGVLIVLIGWQTVLPVSVVERIEMSRTEEGTDPSILGRLRMWEQSLDIIAMNPVSGVGFGNTRYLGFKSYSQGHLRKSVHNGYLSVILETGIIGFLTLMTVFYVSFKQGWHLYHKAKDPFMKGLGLGFVICIVGSLVSNLTGDKWPYLSVMGYFWILLGMITKANMIVELEKQNETPVQG